MNIIISLLINLIFSLHFMLITLQIFQYTFCMYLNMLHFHSLVNHTIQGHFNATNDFNSTIYVFVLYHIDVYVKYCYNNYLHSMKQTYLYDIFVAVTMCMDVQQDLVRTAGEPYWFFQGVGLFCFLLYFGVSN